VRINVLPINKNFKIPHHKSKERNVMLETFLRGLANHNKEKGIKGGLEKGIVGERITQDVTGPLQRLPWK
jgi:hypothetical protein